MTVSIECYRGRFDICHPNKEEWQLRLKTPFGNVTEFFEDEPDAPGVEEALDVIEARQKDFLVKSNRGEKLMAVAAIREHLTECEALLCEGEIAKLEAQADRITAEITRKRELLEYLRKEIEAA